MLVGVVNMVEPPYPANSAVFEINQLQHEWILSNTTHAIPSIPDFAILVVAVTLIVIGMMRFARAIMPDILDSRESQRQSRCEISVCSEISSA